jgi:hypothetical protein
MAATANFPGLARWSFQTFVNADGTTAKTLFTPGSQGSKIVAITAFSTDSSARDLRLSLNRSATNYPFSTIAIPLNSGNTNSVPPVAVLQTTQTGGTIISPTGILPLDQDAQVYFFLQSGDLLTANFTTAVTASTQITIHVWGVDY